MLLAKWGTFFSYSQSSLYFLSPGPLFLVSPLSRICFYNLTSSSTRQKLKPHPSFKTCPRAPQLPKQKSSLAMDFHLMLPSFLLLQTWSQSALSHRCLMISSLTPQEQSPSLVHLGATTRAYSVPCCPVGPRYPPTWTIRIHRGDLITDWGHFIEGAWAPKDFGICRGSWNQSSANTLGRLYTTVRSQHFHWKASEYKCVTWLQKAPKKKETWRKTWKAKYSK